MTDLFDPVSQTVWKDLGWAEPFQAVEVDEAGQLVPYPDLPSLVEIRAAMQRREERGVARGEPIVATLTGGSIVITDEELATYEIALDKLDPAFVAALPGVYDMRVVFTRDDGTEEPAYVGVRELREGF